MTLSKNYVETRRSKGGVMKGLFDLIEEVDGRVEDVEAGIEEVDGRVEDVEAGVVAADSISVTELKVVEREVDIAAEALTGTVTTAADIDGMILGAFPKEDIENAIEEVTFDPETGAITVTLTAAQSAGTPGVVAVTVLQA